MRAAIVLLAFLAPAAWGDTYRCPSGKGYVYQDAPCVQGGERVAVVPKEPKTVEQPMGRVRIGMTQTEVLKEWGFPTSINRTITGSSVSEQWVYRRGRIEKTQYLYLTDGVLRSIQSPRVP